MNNKKVILIDRDGVINQRMEKGCYVTCPSEFSLIEDSIKTMAMLVNEGFSFIVISNQAGVGRGIFSYQQLQQVNNTMLNLLAARGVDLLDVFYCTHHYEENCYCRKPQPGMILTAAEKYALDLSKCLFIGDDPRDVLAANNANTGSVLINCSPSELEESQVKPNIYAPLLSDVMSGIRAFYAH